MSKYYYHKYDKSYYIKGVYYKDINGKILKEYSNELRIIELENLKMSFYGVRDSKSMVEGIVYLTYVESAGWNENQYPGGTDTYALIKGKSYYLGKFTRKNFTHGKSNFIETIKAEEGTYPDNGIHTDGYWYVKGDKATLPIFEIRDGKATAIAERVFIENDKVTKLKARYFIENGVAIKIY